MSPRNGLTTLAGVLCIALCAAFAGAQVIRDSDPDPLNPGPLNPDSGTSVVGTGAVDPNEANVGDGNIRLITGDSVELEALVNYVIARKQLNIVYDENLLANKRVSLKVPGEIPSESLMALLQSVLNMKQLVIAESEVPGLWRIEKSRQLTQIALGIEESQADGIDPGTAVTRVYKLQHATASKVAPLVKPFLSSGSANLTNLDEHDMLIITDYAQNMPRVIDMIELADVPGKQVVSKFVLVEHVDCEQLVTDVNQIIRSTEKIAGGPKNNAELLAEKRTNQVVVIGESVEVEEAIELIKAIDVPLGLETKVYSLKIAAPQQVDKLIRSLIGELAANRLYKSVAEEDSNLLVVTTTRDIHQQVEAVLESADQPLPETQSPVRFYRLDNARAEDVIETLRSIEGDQGVEGVTVDGSGADGPVIDAPTAEQINRRLPGIAGDLSGLAAQAVSLPDARVLADEPTNTIVVIATPEIHPIYEKLIKRLDERRPQVLIQATIISLDTSDDFELGVEIFGDSTDVDNGDLLTFSRLGVSSGASVPGAIGLLTGTSAMGFTGALLGSDTVEVVIRAMESDTRSKVIARPSVLVNDNATGSLASDAEEPFTTTTVPANGNVTTSFGGFAVAGTNIAVTPQISDGDHLKLEYEITLSSFDGTGTGDVPPARSTDSLISEATIPDGYAIVVGGLTQENARETINRVPILGHIPVLEYLFSARFEDKSVDTLFIFIQATVLRDDEFKDLKTVSYDAARQAQFDRDMPTSTPVAIR